jgi:hypothetical protein
MRPGGGGLPLFDLQVAFFVVQVYVIMAAIATETGFIVWGIDQTPYGPVELPALVAWVKDERVTSDAWIYAAQNGSWQKAAEVPEPQMFFCSKNDGAAAGAAHPHSAEYMRARKKRVPISHTATPGQATDGLRLLTKVFVQLLLLTGALQIATPSVFAIDRHWTSGGAGVWSNPSKWTPAGVPQDGDVLIIDSDSDTTMVNDLTGLVIERLVFRAQTSFFDGPTYTLSGNPLTISPAIFPPPPPGPFESEGSLIDNNFGGSRLVIINCALVFPKGGGIDTGRGDDGDLNPGDNTIHLHLLGSLTLSGDLKLWSTTRDYADTGGGSWHNPGELEVSGVIQGAGNVTATVEKYSALDFNGATGNTFSGSLTLLTDASTDVSFSKQAGIVVNDGLFLGDGVTVRYNQDNQVGDNATVGLTGGAQLLLRGHFDTIGNLSMTNVHADATSTLVDTRNSGDEGTGLLTLNGSLTSWVFNDAVVPTIRGVLNLSSGEHDFNILTPGGYAGFEMKAEMRGFGNFSKLGNAALLLTASNSCNSTISVLQGTLDVRHSHALGDTAGPTQLFGGALLLRNMAITDEPLFALGNGSGGVFPGSVLTSVGACSWSGPVLLYTNLVVSGDMTLSGVISGTGGLGCFGLTTVHLTGNNTYTGTNYISGATLQVDGVQPLSPIDLHDSARLQGSGTVGNINYIGSSVVVAPGSSPGILTCGNFNAGAIGSGTLEIELNGTTPGSGYDQISTQGTVNLTGLNLSATLSFSPAQEDSFTIINNDGTDPISGTFPGLRQNKQVRIGGESFHVNYAGGTGNDLVLTRRGHDIVWTNNASGDWNAAQNWSPNIVPGANDTAFIYKGVTVTLNSDVEIYSFTFGDAAGSPTLTGTGTLTISDTATWERGTMSGSGRTVIATGATLSIINVSITLGLSSRTLENGGTVLWTGASLSLLNSAIITNRLGALFEIQGAGALVFGGGAVPRFDNAGIFRKSVNTGTTSLGQIPFNNTGTVEIQTGTLLSNGSFLNDGVVNSSPGTTNRMAANGSASGTFNAAATAMVEWTGGTFTLDSGAQLNGTGLYRINGGSVTFNTDLVVANLDLVIATLSGTGTLTVSNVMNWSGGIMSGSGRTIIPTGATLNAASAGAVSLTGGRTLENGGTVLWTGANISLLNSAVITNRTGALIEIQGAGAPIFGGGAIPRFDNAGVFRKSANTDTTTVGQVPFNNYGTVEVQAGTLLFSGSLINNGAVNLSAGTTNRMAANGSASGTFNTPATALVEWTGGTFTLDSGAQLNGAGLYRINGSSVAFNADVVVANLDLLIATVSGAGTLTVSNLMNWTGGTMSGSGRTIVAAGAALSIPSGVSLNTRTLENGGMVLWSGVGNITFTSAVITNRAGAVFETRGAGALNFGSGSGSRFDNAGTFRKSINTGTTTVAGGVAFSNYNTVEIQTGILAANGGYTSTANSLLNCALGGTTVGTGYGRLQVTGTVTLNGALGVSLANGFLPTTNDTFTVLTAGTRSGTFANFYYPSNDVTMLLSNTANSVIVRVSAVLVLPPPILHIESIAPTAARLYWSTNYPNFHLEYNTSPDTTNWAASALTPVVTGTNFVMTNSLFALQKYYRLSRLPAPYTPPPPGLTIERVSPGAVRLLWTAEDDRRFGLQSSTNLSSANWVPASPPPVILGWNNVVTNTISGAQEFYRLTSQ